MVGQKKTGANSRSPKRLSRQLEQTSMEGRVAVGSVSSYILPILGVGGIVSLFIAELQEFFTQAGYKPVVRYIHVCCEYFP